MPRRRSEGEACLADALAANPLSGWDLTPEFQFDKQRRWKFDFAFPSQKLAIEVDGEHHRRQFKVVRSDYEKRNEAVRQGWRMLHFQASERRKAAEWVLLIREVLCCPPSSALDSDE